MSVRKYVVIPFDDGDEAATFLESQMHNIPGGVRLLNADEYPTKRYNGWTNYETWAVKLWIDNDEGSQNYWREAARDAIENPIENQFMELDRRQVHALMERLKDEHDEGADNLVRLRDDGIQAGIYSDLLSAALSEVNWGEIAESLLEDVSEGSGKRS